MKVAKTDQTGETYPVNTFIVLFWDEHDDYWYPRIYTDTELGKLFADIHYGQDADPFKVYDADDKGVMHECTFRASPMVFDNDDYADARTEILRGDQVVGVACARIDGRA